MIIGGEMPKHIKSPAVVKSAGNTRNVISFPGEHPDVITVGATDNTDTRRWNSGQGSALDVMAPDGVYAADLTGSNGNSSGNYSSNLIGTSISTPHVSGLAGLMLSVDNSLSEKQVGISSVVPLRI